MQFPTVAIFFASLLAFSVNAAPSAITKKNVCTFGVYECSSSYNGIEQCGYGANGLQWEQIGLCPTSTHCGNIGSIPYCLAN